MALHQQIVVVQLLLHNVNERITQTEAAESVLQATMYSIVEEMKQIMQSTSSTLVDYNAAFIRWDDAKIIYESYASETRSLCITRNHLQFVLEQLLAEHSGL